MSVSLQTGKRAGDLETKPRIILRAEVLTPPALHDNTSLELGSMQELPKGTEMKSRTSYFYIIAWKCKLEK